MLRTVLGFRASLKPSLSAAVLALIGFSSAEAVSIRFDVVGGDPEADLTGLGAITPIDPGDGNPYDFWNLADAPVPIEGVLLNSWTVQLADRWVTNNVSVTNETGALQTIVASVNQPLDTALSFSSFVSSSFGVAFTDSNADDSFLLQGDGASIYGGTVDSTSTLNLGLSNGALSADDCAPLRFPGCSGSESDGVASLAASGLAEAIGIRLAFQISPGDSVAFTSRFEISPDSATPVPEPSTGLLMALGLAGLARARRDQYLRN